MMPPEAKTAPLAAPITSLWGVGGERAAQLARLEIFTVEDLLLHRPRRYEDRRHFRTISELTRDEAATARGTIVAPGLKRFRGGSKSVFEIILDDGTARLHCRWWNLPFMENYFAIGDEVFVFGKLIETKPRTMDHPETEVIEGGEESFIHINRIAPIYPLTEGLPQRWLRGLIWRTLETSLNRKLPNRSPAPDLKLFPTRANAVRMIHFPEELTDVEIARRRLALDEFVALQLRNPARAGKISRPGRARLPCGGDNRLMKPFLARLGFKLTARANEGAPRNPRGHGRRASDATVVARRCRFGQDGRGRVHGVDGAGKRFQRRADGADGNSGGTTFPEFSKLV